MMDLPALQTALTGALDRSTRTFRLAAGTLGSPPVQKLLEGLLQAPAPALVLSGASVDVTGDRPFVQGALASTPQSPYEFLAGFQVVATFRLDAEGVPQLHLTLHPPADQRATWGLPNALPGCKNSFFGAFTWANARFEFDSQDVQALPASFPTGYGFPTNSSKLLDALKKGMWFQADLTYKGKEADLLWLLGGATVQVAGPIEWNGAQPRMDLATGSLPRLDVGGFALPTSLHLVTVLSEIPATRDRPASTTSTPLGVLQGTLERPIQGKPPLSIPFFVQLYQDPPLQVTAQGSFEGASSLMLKEVAGVLGASSLDDQQAKGFPELSGLSLRTVLLTLDTRKKQLLAASATVGFKPPGGPWKPFGDLLSFDDLTVTFTMLGPTSSPSFETIVDCKSTLAGGTLDAWISLPVLDFGCELQDGENHPIDLTRILDEMTGGAFTKLTPDFKLLCTELKVLGNPSANTYRFQATVRDNWYFEAMGAKFALSAVGFDISRQTGQNGGTTGEVVAELLVADVPVQLSAGYEGEQQGWSFSGGTLGPQEISLTKLLDEALKLFGLRVPSFAPDVTITDLQMMLHTATMDFGFSCEGLVSMGRTTDRIGIGIDIGRTHDDPDNPTVVTTVFRGYLTVGSSIFEVDFTAAPAGKSVLFKWVNTEEPLGFDDIAKFFGYSMAPLPENLDITLAKAAFYYDFTAKTVVVSAESKKGRQILFASLVPLEPPNSPRLYLFDLDVPLKLELKDLPVIGDKLPPGLQLGIENLQVIVASTEIPDLVTLNSLVTGIGVRALIPAKLNKGLTFAAMLHAGTDRLPIVVPLSEASPPAPPPRFALAAAGEGNKPNYQAAAVWFPIAKTFGPVSIERIGVEYEDSKLFVLLDASLGFSALKLEMSGLGVGSPLAEVNLVPHLDGISVGFSSGPIIIHGGLLRVPPAQLPQRPPPNDVAFEYIGEVTIAVEPYLIGGMASYAKVGGRSSFFLFAQVTGHFGGPPAFFITGFMGGFGYNSALALPAPEQIHAFPFIAGLDDPDIFGTDKPQPLDVMNALAGGGGKKAWVTPAVGESWIAGGIRFRSFELVDGRALLVVTFGKDFAVALFGLATMSLPQGCIEEAYAYVELQMEAVFKPTEGFFGIDASLTQNSYLLMQDCHLTGGFAFWMWFGSHEHAGDFVVAIGGYHPAFVPPAWYPKLARVGFNWPVSAEVMLKGGVYMALTPTAIMAGGNLEAVYQSGNLRAWFTAYANMMIRWKPFYFTASVGISIGASYRLTLGALSTTLSVELGASLGLWGPPTGGTVRVHWYILSFSIPFGAKPKDEAALELDWKGFGSLLPNKPAPNMPNPPLRAMALAAASSSSTAAVLGVQVGRGLIRTDDQSGAWIVRADEFVFTTESAIPATSIKLGDVAVDLRDVARSIEPPATIDIRPMNATGITSTHTVKVTRLGETDPLRVDWAPVVHRRNLPEALWGTPLGKDKPPPTANTIPNLPAGVTLTAPPAKEGTSPGVMDIASITAPLDGGAMPLSAGLQSDSILSFGEDAGSTSGLAAGQVQLIDNFMPGLDDGTYQIELTQAVTAPGATIDPVAQLFTIQGPRFALDPADIHAQFPPNGVNGQFDRTLPQIMLSKRLLPWERRMPGLDRAVPWLALLVLQQGELIDFAVDGAPSDPEAATKQAIANGAQTMTVRQLLAVEQVRTPQLDPKAPLSEQELGMKCQAIRISKETFVRVVPTAAEMRCLAHVRKVNTGDKVLLGMKDEGSFSVVMANRFPAAAAGVSGAKNIVHLVSLEGFGDLLDGDAPADPAEAQVQLVSLASWTFTCIEDPAQTFAGLVQALAYAYEEGKQPQRRPADSLLLRVPSNSATQPRLADGYVQLEHHAQSGKDKPAWFRGPFSPVVAKPVTKAAPFKTAAEAVGRDAATGDADLSLAAAWQIARSLALGDEAFATALLRVRRKARSTLDKIAARSSKQDRFVELAKLVAGGVATKILHASKAGPLRLSTPARAARSAAAKPIDALRVLAADPAVHKALIEEMKGDPDAGAVAQWLGRLQLLMGVPFVHLVPDAQMLPAGSIRFFYVDPNWIGAMTDGALSIGIGTSLQSAMDDAITRELAQMAASAALAVRTGATGGEPLKPAALTCGLLIRSAVVSGFPGLQVSGKIAGAPVAPLRIDHVGPDVLLCLFNGMPDTVTLAQPQEGIELGVDDNGQITTRIVKSPEITNGEKITVFDPRNPGATTNVVRPGGLRVLDVRGLLGKLEALKVKPGAIGPSDVAVQLLRGTETIDFSSKP